MGRENVLAMARIIYDYARVGIGGLQAQIQTQNRIFDSRRMLLTSFLRNYVSTIQHAGCHIFPISRIAFDHLVLGLEARQTYSLDTIGFMLCVC
jgi:hypothetical protein